MNDRAVIGGNNPPADPIDTYLEPFGDAISESDNWLDGSVVETLGQMEVVDAILADLRKAGAGIGKARLAVTKPWRDKTDAENARWKPTVDDIDRRKKCLTAAVDPFKRKLADEKAAEKRRAYEEADRKQREADELARQAAAVDYDAQVKADAAKREAMDAQKAASAANRDTVKGLKTVHHHEIENMGALVNWIAKNDKDAMRAFATEYARKHHREAAIDGVKTWTTKEAR